MTSATRRAGRASFWSLDHVDPLPGTTFLAYLDTVLPAGGRGPLPRAAEPLPDEPSADPTRVRWGGGSLDGVLSVRGGSGSGQPPRAAASAILALVRGSPATPDVHGVAERLTEIGSPQDVDRLLAVVRADSAASPTRLACLARWLCEHGTNRRQVKVGLALLGECGTAADCDLAVRLGLIEEFTLYSVVALRKLLAEPDLALLDLADQVVGWGRIHAVLRLRGSTSPQVRRWLLHGGYANAVMDEEIAFVAATTGGLLEALEQDADDTLLDHAGALLAALALGGPAEDMSDYADGAAALRAYFRRMAGSHATLARLRHLCTLERYLTRWATGNPHLTERARIDLASAAADLLERPDWPDVVRAAWAGDDVGAVRCSIRPAGRLGLDPLPALREWLHREPHDAYLWQELLNAGGREQVSELVDLAVRLLPLDELPTGPSLDVGFGPDFAANNCLDVVLQRLQDFPGAGWRAVAAGLVNRTVPTRNMALRVLAAWPQGDWPEQAVDMVRTVAWRDPDDGLRGRARAMVSAADGDVASLAGVSEEPYPDLGGLAVHVSQTPLDAD